MNIDSIDSELSLKVAIVEDTEQQQAQQLIAQAYLSVEYNPVQQWLITLIKTLLNRHNSAKNYSPIYLLSILIKTLNCISNQ